MKLLLKVSIYEFCDAGADYAFADLTPEYAQALLKRKALFDTAKAADGTQRSGLYEMHYWDDPCLWLGGAMDEEAIPKDTDLWSFMDEHLTRESSARDRAGDAVVVPDDSDVPEYFAQSTEMGQTVISDDDVFFTSYPRHVDWEHRR